MRIGTIAIVPRYEPQVTSLILKHDHDESINAAVRLNNSECSIFVLETKAMARQ